MIFPSILAFFTLENSHPLIATPYLLWRSLMVLKKREGGRNGRERKERKMRKERK